MSDEPDPELTRERLRLLETWHADDLAESLNILLEGIPPEGGIVTKEILSDLITSAFTGGVIAEANNPNPFIR